MFCFWVQSVAQVENTNEEKAIAIQLCLIKHQLALEEVQSMTRNFNRI